MSWSDPQTLARVQPLPVGHISQMGICWKPWKRPQSWHVQIWKSSLRDAVASEPNQNAEDWVYKPLGSLMAHKTRLSNTSGLAASSYSHAGSEIMFSGTSTSQWRKTEWHSQHPHCVYRIHALYTCLQNTYTASTYPHTVPIQGTQDTYRTAHMGTVHMLPYTACIVPKLRTHSIHMLHTQHSQNVHTTYHPHRHSH